MTVAGSGRPRARAVARKTGRRGGEVLLGILVGLLCVELGLRWFSSGSTNLERLPMRGQAVSIRDDSDHGPAVEVRYYHEGVATSHFSPARGRLTGNAAIAGAPTGVILGDSVVEGFQVLDGETMGAVIERTARSSGLPLNVRQYGWSGAAVNRYVSVAEDVLARWSPLWVAVILNESDLVESVSVQSSPTLAAPLQPPTKESVRTAIVRRLDRGLNEAMGLSVLAAEVLRRLSEINRGRPDAVPAAQSVLQSSVTPADAVHALNRAYGSRLVIVYGRHVGGADDRTIDPLEARLLRECVASGVRCESTRAAMVDAYLAEQHFVRGFSNTAPNVGHPNSLGHRVIGETVWHTVSGRAAARLTDEGTR
jgi:hypothetical protein